MGWFGDVLVINDLNSNDDVSYVIDSSSTSNQMSWQLYDDSNPAKGVQITFENVAADLCLFEINFICPNDRQIHYKPADGRIDSFVYKKKLILSVYIIQTLFLRMHVQKSVY